jgi:hypothetical protein
MRCVSPCPYCGQPATIPLNVDAEAIVHCPLCQYEFDLGRALLNATEAPPEHIAELPLEFVPLGGAAASNEASQATSAARVPGDRNPNEDPVQPRIVEGELPIGGSAIVGENGPGIGLPDRPWGVSAAAPVKEQIRRAVRNAVGLVVSGLLGLALAYGLLNWIGPPSLRFWSRQKPPAAEKEGADKSVSPDADREFPGLDKNRFSDDHRGP